MDGLLLDRRHLGHHLDLAETATLAALLRCCIRELGAPRGRVWAAGPYVMFRVGGTLLRVRAHGGLALRLSGPAERLVGGTWRRMTSELLVTLVARELADSDGDNPEFAPQVTASREAIRVLLSARERAEPPADPWLASEQALVTGHPFHPSPKAGIGPDRIGYAPEAHARFPLRMLGVRADLLDSQGETAVLDTLGTAPPGYVLLPAHPWQVDLLADELQAPLADGRLIDLGEGPRMVWPTSSVRTVYDPAAGVCLKFSLNVRITNCVRKNAWYELAGAVELTERLRPVFHHLGRRFPGVRWLPEPGYRSAALGTRLVEGLGVIVRSGPWSVCGPGITPVLPAALATSPDHGGIPPSVCAHWRADPAGWWRSYVARVALPVLEAYVQHGVILESHLQNVLVGVDAEGSPVEVVFRDLEGTKLVAGRHDVSGLPAEVAKAITYSVNRGWNRVAYCLVVNHLAEVAATVAERSGRDEWNLLPDLWAIARDVLAEYAAEHGYPVPVAALLSEPSLPAKSNLLVRWRRFADRAAGYVTVTNPLAPRRPQ